MMKIAISIVAALFLIGCGEGDKKAVEASATQTETPIAAVKSEPAPVKDEVKNDTVDKVKTAVNDVADKSKEVTNKAADSAKEVVTSMTDTMTSMMPTTTTATASGESIFKVCASCHGTNGEKAALGKSQIIKGWSASKVSDALKGYKADGYGASMKAIMKGQVSKLSNDDIKAVSEYISKL